MHGSLWQGKILHSSNLCANSVNKIEKLRFLLPKFNFQYCTFIVIFAFVKKVILSIVLLAYGFASFGVSLNYLYCCDQLKEITVSLTSQHEEGCTMKMGDRKCCDNKIVTLKIATDQRQNLVQDYHFEQPLLSTTPLLYFFDVQAGSGIQAHPQYHNLPPPLVLNRTVLFANFRI